MANLKTPACRHALDTLKITLMTRRKRQAANCCRIYPAICVLKNTSPNQSSASPIWPIARSGERISAIFKPLI